MSPSYDNPHQTKTIMDKGRDIILPQGTWKTGKCDTKYYLCWVLELSENEKPVIYGC